ncbi:MAG TPA: DUF1573 domain-containing protein [Bacteroidales bacterium]|nr:DUF1573 domain-containing protein [Bacteroidales bacterium]
MKLESNEHDFGVFREEDGKREYTFMVLNSGTEPLVIQNIVASCGCTTPSWTKSPVAPGAEGKITAVYDPFNRPGPFRKTLTVYSNSGPSPLILTLKGEVKGKPRTEQDYYPWQVGQIRLSGNSIFFPDVHNDEKRIRVLPFINTGLSQVKIEFENVPAYMELSTVPRTIKPGGRGLIECVFYGSRAGKWGFVNDEIRIKINGTAESSPLMIQALIMEDFSKLSKYDRMNPPVLKLETNKIDLGTVVAGSLEEVEFPFVNAGKRDLIIRTVWGSSTCFRISNGDNLTIPAGGKNSVKAEFSTEKLSGKVSRMLYIFSNDPANPKMIVSVVADISPLKTKKVK